MEIAHYQFQRVNEFTYQGSLVKRENKGYLEIMRSVIAAKKC